VNKRSGKLKSLQTVRHWKKKKREQNRKKKIFFMMINCDDYDWLKQVTNQWQ
jgi:hypothetical protein